MFKRNLQTAAFRWAAVMLAASPVSLMVSGYHGNTDPVMVMFLFLAGVACVDGKSWLSDAH